MKDLIVIGGGGFAKEVIWLANDCSRKVRGVLDDSAQTHNTQVQGATVLGDVSNWINYKDCEFIIAIGSPRTRKKVLDKMLTFGEPDFAILIHPSVRLSNTVSIGEGSIICAGSILTADISLGKHNILNLNVTVGHECEFADFVTIAPMVAVSGNVKLQYLVEVGTGAVIRQGLELAEGSMLGMGGILTKNIPERLIFAGNPAKKLKEIVE
ncbi:acetyltransferase [Pseudoalteromonas sp. SIMBA_153]|jgi:sugar O-acyltransferase (sialic acid O-acetyltransferase NeuD family)|uniref:acetyltransferase n=1 Tax=Pseudoalteromonas sp. 2CM39R TaxID=2929856 RepID=UPI0020BF8FCF|nr:acetyltransferase [Pseudoalteromonas sp. 2CM39R]MCK8126381.1 acetyltransferase [Pseudoalteromonas sp. 2CM39R]